MIRRSPEPGPPQTVADSNQLHVRHRLAVRTVDDALARHPGNAQLVDVLLDVRNALRPPEAKP